VISLTRRYEFPAAHVLRHPSLSDEENWRVYGKCANPNGHGHDYGVEVTVAGPVDVESGHIISTKLLDAIFEERVGSRFAHSDLNRDPAFATRVPTAENIALVIHGELAPTIAQRSSARLLRVLIRETPKNTFEYGAPS
jgi:6-pyruvoyltetrahydropterin/6-carboxytetrahydropterin synthase